MGTVSVFCAVEVVKIEGSGMRNAITNLPQYFYKTFLSCHKKKMIIFSISEIVRIKRKTSNPYLSKTHFHSLRFTASRQANKLKEGGIINEILNNLLFVFKVSF